MSTLSRVTIETLYSCRVNSFATVKRVVKDQTISYKGARLTVEPLTRNNVVVPGEYTAFIIN